MTTIGKPQICPENLLAASVQKEGVFCCGLVIVFVTISLLQVIVKSSSHKQVIEGSGFLVPLGLMAELRFAKIAFSHDFI